jgi:[ribosomal protein S5]-alanine N-acetyltransferase
VPKLQRLHPGHAPAVLAFELANRSYFAAFISDRGDEFFDQFAERELGRLAAARHGLHTLRAATSRENAASQKVLTKAGFVPVGQADPAHLGDKQGTWYQRDLTVRDAPQQRAAARDQDGTWLAATDRPPPAAGSPKQGT